MFPPCCIKPPQPSPESSNGEAKKRNVFKNVRKKGGKCTGVEIAKALPEETLGKSALAGKELVRVEQPMGVHTLVVPGAQPNVHPIYFDKVQFCRLAKQSRVLSATEKINMEEAQEAAKRQAEKMAQDRKNYFQSCEKYRVKGARLSELEAEAKRKAMHLLARAYEMRQESEDEVKHANRLILSTKCHAIRVAQIAEKQLISKELAAEESRLDRMMEQQRQLDLEREEQERRVKGEKNQAYLRQLLNQIEEVETERIEDSERKVEEARLLDEAAMQVQLDELHEYHKKLEKQTKTREELAEINRQLKYFQDVEREERRQADLKVQKFLEDKLAKELAREAEIQKAKAAKELEIARMRAAQERVSDVQAQQDEMKALRAQDEVEREWRRKEKMEAEKRLQQEEDLRKARIQQIAHKRVMQAVEIEREREQYENIIRKQQLDAEKEQLEVLKRQGDQESFRLAILKQINDKERERINMRKQDYQEGVAVRTEERSRQRALKHTLARKLEELRAQKVPEIYVKEIERQLKLKEAGDN